MRKVLASLLGLLLLPAFAFAAPVSWDFAGGILQPLQSAWSALVKADHFQATSTTASIFPFASTTALSATTLCLSADCRTAWPTGSGSGNVATSTIETKGLLSYWTSSGGTPATLGQVATSTETCTSASGVTCTSYTVVGTGGGAIALSAIPNSSLANSTISGVALGGTLNALTATNSTLTFSGSYDGSTARTVGLNLANANTWSALQQFNGNASSTQESAYAAYFGATATTTIDSTGNIVIPSGSGLTNTGRTDGCATWASAVLTSTGTACGSGGGSAYPFTPSSDGGINTSATSTPIQGTNPGLGLDVSNTSWYGIGGALFGYASTTNGSTILGISSGGNNATTSATLSGTTAVGYQSLKALTNGVFSTGVGFQSLTLASTSGQNTALGYYSLRGSGTATFSIVAGQNVGIGDFALASTTSGSQNTALGSTAGQLLTTGTQNVLIGSNTGAQQTVTGARNTIVGHSAGRNLSSGADNTLIGSTAGNSSVITGLKNTSLGVSSLTGISSARNNVAIGFQAGSQVTNGYDNILVGPVLNAGGTQVTTGGGNIGIGYNIGFPASNSTLQLNIGNTIFGTLAATSTVTSQVLPLSGSLSIGSTSPYAKFVIATNAGDTTTTLFAVASSTSAATSTLFTIQNTGQIFATGLTISSGLQTGVLCLSSTNEIINDSVACLASSKRFKNDIKPLSDSSGLDELMKLTPVSFKYKPEYNGALQSNPNYSGDQVGFIAEDVQKIDPRLVVLETQDSQNGSIVSKKGDVHSVRYEQITAIIVKAVQEQQRQISVLSGSKPVRSSEENWQDIMIALLFMWCLVLTFKNKRDKRSQRSMADT
jgi:hypothetical protein